MVDNRIKKAMMEIGDNNGYYNAKKILPSFDRTMVYFIIGERRIGKTDFFLHLACKLYQDYNVQTMWIRNKLVELQDAAFLGSFLNDAKLRGWCPDEWETRSDGVYSSKERDADQIILFQSISTFSNRRGGANPRVLMMVFDEFMPEDRKYPKQASKGLMSLTKTVFSGNTECRVFCLSNIISAVNPYFACFRIYPSSTITEYIDKGIVIEKCRGYNKAIDIDNPWNMIYKAGNYGDYADESEDAILSLVVKAVPKGAKRSDLIIATKNGNYALYTKDGYGYFTLHKGNIPNSMLIYTADRDLVNDKVLYINNHLKGTIKNGFDCGFSRFVGANCLFDIMSIVYNDM